MKSQKSKGEEAIETFSVLVLDMHHYMDEDENFTVHGFATAELAREYARRRTRSSLEESRCADPEATKRAWFDWGEDCLAGDYKGYSELDFFIANPATGDECDFVAIEPR